MNLLLATLDRVRGLVRRDDRNIRALADRLGCSNADAARVYHLARSEGFGAAYAKVFGAEPPAARRLPD
jgi:hypothetical protein